MVRVKVQTPLALRSLVTAAFGCFVVMGLGFAAWPEQDGGFAVGYRAFYAAMGLAALVCSIRCWRCAVFIESDELVSRGFLRTRRIALQRVLDVSAERSDWMLFWVLNVNTAEREYWFEEVRDYPWRAGGERMKSAAADLLASARAAQGEPGSPSGP